MVFLQVSGSVFLRSVPRRGRPVVSSGGVVVDAGRGGGVDVNGGVVEAGNAVDQLVMGLVGDGVSFNNVESVVDGQGDLSAHTVPDPAQPDTLDATDSGHVTYRCFGGVDQVGVDGIHESAVDVLHRASKDGQDRHRDEQADDGVGQREAGYDSDYPEDHGQ